MTMLKSGAGAPLGGTGAGPAAPFVGRQHIAGLLDTLVGAASEGGAAEVIIGEAGIGKTCLLQRVARNSSSRVLWARGVETESGVPFAAVSDVLVPLRDHFDAVPATQRRALEVALAIADGGPPTSLAVCSGALRVLAAAGETAPLLLLVDDLQWVDAESRQVLLFVARRVGGERLGVIFTLCDDPGLPLPAHDLPVSRLAGLTTAECRELARSRYPNVPEHVVDDLALMTGGNPLALLETLRTSARERTPGSPDVTGGIRVGTSPQRAWQRVLTRLPERTRQALFLVTIVRSSGAPPLPAMLESLGLSLDDLTPAERQGLVQFDGDRVELRHPLLRQVLIDTTPLAIRIPMFHALAEAASPEQRPWFLSLAALGPDDDLAAALADAAGRARVRGAFGTAATLGHRAAELSTQTPVRASFLLDACIDAFRAGELVRAEQWCQHAVRLRSDHDFLVEITRIRASALTWLGQPAAAADLLIGAAHRLRQARPESAAELLCEAQVSLWMSGDGHRSRAVNEAALGLVERGRITLSPRADSLIALAQIMAGAVDEGTARIRSVERRLSCCESTDHQAALLALAQGWVWVGRFEDGRRLVNAALEQLRSNGAPNLLALALVIRSQIEFWTGDWNEAYADAMESLQRADELRQRGTSGFALLAVAWIEAARGDRASCEERFARLRSDLNLNRIGLLGIWEPAVLGLAALADGEPGIAADHLEDAWTAAIAVGLDNPCTMPFVGDLAEARIRTGDPERAGELLDWLETRAASTGLLHPALVACRCRGMLAAGDSPGSEFVTAHALLRGARLPFEQARTLACEGEALRRARRSVDARAALREARRLFNGLGASSWAHRVTTELAATGARGCPSPRWDGVDARRWNRIGLDLLTPQELQVARLVAAGKNNEETATSLYISRKTVEAHLTHAYRKLGIHSRTELTRVILTEYGCLTPSTGPVPRRRRDSSDRT